MRLTGVAVRLTRVAVLAVALAALLPLSGCPDEEEPCTGGWAPVFEGIDRSVLAATERGGSGEVYLAGGSLGGPAGALAFHWDGEAWHELDAGTDETLWWVWAEPGGEALWYVGEGGVALRWDGDGFERVETGTTATLYGVWGSGADDVWIVGGTPGEDGGDDDDVIALHWDGEGLTRDETAPVADVTLFKVWGSGADDLWISGERGTMLHYRDGVWTDLSGELDTVSSVLTVHGCAADEVYAVAGSELFTWDGDAWSLVEEAMPLGILNGVSCGEAGVLAVGNGGMKLRWDRASGTWFDEQFDKPWDTDYHGALVAADGTTWAVGGNFQIPIEFGAREGVVAFRGCPVPSTDAP